MTNFPLYGDEQRGFKFPGVTRGKMITLVKYKILVDRKLGTLLIFHGKYFVNLENIYYSFSLAT